MKKNRITLISINQNLAVKIVFILVFLFANIVSFSQESDANVNIAISKNIVSIDGQKFYIHIVKKGQYLYSISKTYNVSQDDIIRFNPGAKYELQVDQAIKIPVNKQLSTAVKKEITTKSGDTKQKKQVPSAVQIDPFIYHKVDSGQTVYRLSKLYNVPTDTIYFYNPQSKTVLRIGDVVKIPKSKEDLEKGTMNYTLETNFIQHQVEKKETLFSLSRKFGVSISDLIRNNKELVWGLKYGRIIKIPVVDTVYQEAYTVLNDSVVVDTLKNMNDPFIAYEYYKNNCDSASDENKLKKLNIAILLPLQQKRIIALQEKLAQAENMTEEEMTVEFKAEVNWADRTYSKLKVMSANFVDFYLGSLMAIDTLKKMGVSVNVELIDTEQDSNKIIDFFTKDGIEDIDLIIGPFYSSNVKVAARFTDLYKIPLVSPLSQDPELIKNSDLVFQATPSESLQKKAAAKLLGEYSDDNIILLYPNDTISKLNAVELKSNIFSYLSSEENIDSILFKEIVYSDSVEFHLEHTLSETKENLVFVMSSDMAMVTNVVSNLHFLADKYSITVFGEPQWQRFKNVDISQFHNLNIHLYTPFYADYKSEQTKLFLGNFREMFEFEPHWVGAKGEIYSFLGYDLTYFFVSALNQYGNKFYRCIGSYHPDLLLTDYKFIKYNGNRGYENVSLSIITFEKDLEITNHQLLEEKNMKGKLFGKN